jgi:hypothetical protein
MLVADRVLPGIANATPSVPCRVEYAASELAELPHNSTSRGNSKARPGNPIEATVHEISELVAEVSERVKEAALPERLPPHKEWGRQSAHALDPDDGGSPRPHR